MSVLACLVSIYIFDRLGCLYAIDHREESFGPLDSVYCHVHFFHE